MQDNFASVDVVLPTGSFAGEATSTVGSFAGVASERVGSFGDVEEA
jgi:hypothetical protein